MGGVVLTVQYFVMLPVFALVGEARGAARAARRLGSDALPPSDRSSLRRAQYWMRDPRHLGRTITTRRPPCSSTACPCARCRKSASRGRRTTPAFPLAGHRVVPRAAAGSSPSSSTRSSSTRSRCSSSSASSRWRSARSRAPGELPEGDEELARREAVGQGHHRELARRAEAARSSSPSITSRTPRRRSSPQPTARRRDPHGRRRRRVGHALGRRRGKRGRDGTGEHRAPARAPLPALARDALLDLHRLPRLRGQRGRVQGHGARLVRHAPLRRPGPQGHRAHERRGVPLDLDYFDFHTTAKRSYSRRFVDLFGPPRAPHQPLDPTTPEGTRFADIAASVQRVLEDTLVDLRARLHDETGLAGSSASAAASR